MIKKDKYRITIDEVLNDEFSLMVCSLVSVILQKLPERNGYNPERDNRQLLQEDEKHLLKLWNILLGIKNSLETIDTACLLMRRFYGKDFFEKNGVSVIDYSAYHYEMICCKVSTLKDLFFKLANHFYNLRLSKMKCNWKNIEEKEAEIQNPFLFSLLNGYHNNLKILFNKRNKAEHEGIINCKAFDNVEHLVSATMMAKNKEIPEDDFNEFIITKGSFSDFLVRESRKKVQSEVETIRNNAFIYTKCIMCSLTDKLAEFVRNSEVLLKQSKNMEVTFDHILKKRCSYAEKRNECPYWKSVFEAKKQNSESFRT